MKHSNSPITTIITQYDHINLLGMVILVKFKNSTILRVLARFITIINSSIP